MKLVDQHTLIIPSNYRHILYTSDIPRIKLMPDGTWYGFNRSSYIPENLHEITANASIQLLSGEKYQVKLFEVEKISIEECLRFLDLEEVTLVNVQGLYLAWQMLPSSFFMSRHIWSLDRIENLPIVDGRKRIPSIERAMYSRHGSGIQDQLGLWPFDSFTEELKRGYILCFCKE